MAITNKAKRSREASDRALSQRRAVLEALESVVNRPIGITAEQALIEASMACNLPLSLYLRMPTICYRLVYRIRFAAMQHNIIALMLA